MRAVEQIIRYLHEHGSLTAEHLAHLERLGLWQRAPEEAPEAHEDLGPADGDESVTRGEQREERRSRRGPVRPRPADVTAVELNDFLAEQFNAWRTDLDGLVQLGRRLGVCRDWTEAAVVVRNSDADALASAVVESLRQRAPSLRSLWSALALEDYRELPRDWRASMPAVGAYRNALKVHDYSEMSRDQWVLKQPAVGGVFNLRQAQRRLLRAAEAVQRSRPELLVSGFHRDYHPLAYWTFVVLHTIRRPPSQPGEHEPRRARPPEAGWKLIQAHAAWMDPVAFVRDLVRQGRDEQERAYVCPRNWDHLTDKV